MTRPLDAMIGRLDRLLSEFLIAAADPSLDEADRQTIKHHADDLIGVGGAALKKLEALPPALRPAPIAWVTAIEPEVRLHKDDPERADRENDTDNQVLKYIGGGSYSVSAIKRGVRAKKADIESSLIRLLREGVLERTGTRAQLLRRKWAP